MKLNIKNKLILCEYAVLNFKYQYILINLFKTKKNVILENLKYEIIFLSEDYGTNDRIHSQSVLPGYKT